MRFCFSYNREKRREEEREGKIEGGGKKEGMEGVRDRVWEEGGAEGGRQLEAGMH